MKKTYKVKKTNNSKVDKNISTNDLSNSNSKGKNSKLNKKDQKKSVGINAKKEEQKDNLTLLKEKTALLLSNLSKIKLDVDIERNNSIQDINILNEQIKEVNNEINRLTVDNKYLTNILYSFQKKLDTEINQNIIHRSRHKSLGNEKIEDKLNKNIKLREKMILNSKKNLKLIKKEKELLENELKGNDAPDTKENLEKKLEEIKKIQENKIKEVEELKSMKNDHNKVCAKKLSELLRQYDVIKNEYEYEAKKAENRKLDTEKIINKKNNIKKTSKLLNNDNKNNDSNSEQNKSNKKNKIKISKTKNIFNYYFKQINENKKRKENNLEFKDIAFLSDDYINLNSPVKSVSNNNFNTNESNSSIKIKKRLNNSNVNNNNNYESIRTLFTKSEKSFLSKLIPDNCLDNYENKFNSLVNENLNIKTKINENLKLNNINKNNNLLKLGNSELQNNVNMRKQTNLNLKRSEYNQKKREIIEKIKFNQLNMKNIDNILNKKNNDYNRLLKEFKNIYSNIQNGTLTLKEGEHLTQENILAMDKWGMRGSNNTSFDEINEDIDYANISEYEHEENDDNHNEEENTVEN